LEGIANNRQKNCPPHPPPWSQSVSTSIVLTVNSSAASVSICVLLQSTQLEIQHAVWMKRECRLTVPLNECDVTDSICSSSTMPDASPRRRDYQPSPSSSRERSKREKGKTGGKIASVHAGSPTGETRFGSGSAFCEDIRITSSRKRQHRSPIGFGFTRHRHPYNLALTQLAGKDGRR
jgi:hypothetical protein